MHWISIPVHIGDPIGIAYGGATWRVMFEEIMRLLISVPPLARWRRLFTHSGIAIADKETFGGG